MPPDSSTGRTGPPRVVARSEAELIEAVHSADAAGIPVRIVGADAETADVPGRVVQVASRGVTVNDDGCSADSLAYCGGVQVTVAAGEDWAGFVAIAVERDWVGVEALAGHRGTVGGATVVNAHAFGRRVGDAVAAVRTWDRATGSRRRFAMVDCGFAADGSRFSRERMADGTGRYVVLDVAFLFRHGSLTDPIRDPELAALLQVGMGQRVALPAVHRAVLAAAAQAPDRPTGSGGTPPRGKGL